MINGEPTPLDLVNSIATGNTAIVATSRPPAMGTPGIVLAVIEGLGPWEELQEFVAGLHGCGHLSGVQPTIDLSQSVGKFMDHIRFMEAEVMTASVGDVAVVCEETGPDPEPLRIWFMGFVGKATCNRLITLLNEAPGNESNQLPFYQ